jgi:Family of unknown function (DUF6022)
MTKEFFNQSMTIFEIGEVLSNYVNKQWKKILDENLEELKELFPEFEDATYGMYLDKLLPPIWKELEKSGFQSAEETREDDFVIAGCLNFRNSIEKAKWGSPNREIRVFWIVIKNEHENQIGTLLFELSHSHVQFEVPVKPRFIPFGSSDKVEIKSKILQINETQY